MTHFDLSFIYNKSLNICKTIQNYSQDINYYKTVKKVHKKVIKIFHHFTTFTLPLYGNQMNRTSLMDKLGKRQLNTQ